MPTVYKFCLDYKVKHSIVLYPIAFGFIVNHHINSKPVLIMMLTVRRTVKATFESKRA